MERKTFLKEIIDSCIHGRILLPEVYFIIDFELSQKYMEIIVRSVQFEEFASQCLRWDWGRRAGLMVSAGVLGVSGPGSSLGLGHCVVFLGKILNSHSASLHPRV